MLSKIDDETVDMMAAEAFNQLDDYRDRNIHSAAFGAMSRYGLTDVAVYARIARAVQALENKRLASTATDSEHKAAVAISARCQFRRGPSTYASRIADALRKKDEDAPDWGSVVTKPAIPVTSDATGQEEWQF